jgi:preprotein translocase subunit SecD
MENYRLRSFFAWAGVVLAFIWLVPNMVNLDNKWWFTKRKINFGLDIQGGLHLVMGVDVNNVVKESSTRLIGQLKSEMTEKKVEFSDIKLVNGDIGEIEVLYADASHKVAINKYIEDKYSTMLQSLGAQGQSLHYRYYDNYLQDYKGKVLQQAIETIRNRIDEFGVAEPSISAQGSDRINIQLPGITDAEQAKALINTSARLEFMMVDNSKNLEELQKLIDESEKKGSYSFKTLRYSQYVAKLNEDLKSQLPADTMLLFEKAANATNLEAGRTPMLVHTNTGLGGESLDDAFVTFNEYGAPEVSLVFNPSGANKFSELTGANIGKQMAITLDKVIKSAPSIQTKISGGRAVITLGNSRDRESALSEAKMISTSLRAGALPTTLEQLEERRVGPTLGSDSVSKARFASLIGSLLIIIFILARYKASGLVAVISLALNVVISLALLSSLGATLTLPGIAGIALTVGFAVDANVLIFERIREELHRGSSYKAALKEGYHKAMSAILDSNITTAATAVVLLYFGTGPVKGFAVTLLIGIFTTLFSNVFISKVIMDTVINKWRVEKLSI